MTENQIYAMVPVVLGIVLPLSVFLTLFFFFRARHTERMAMIEKGITFERKGPKAPSRFWIKAGLVLFGLGLGITSAIFLQGAIGVKNENIYPAMMFLFGGGSLVVYYMLSGNIQHIEYRDQDGE